MQRAITDEAKDQRRQALLSAALNEFFEKGFAATRMDDVAKRAKLSKGTVYLYFESKEAMFIALLESLAEPKLEMFESVMEQAESFEVAIRTLFEIVPVIIRTTEMPRFLKVLIGDSQMFPDIVALYRDAFIERALKLIAGLLTRAHNAGEICVEAPELTARIVVAPVVLSGIWHVVFRQDEASDVDLETLFRIHGDMLIRSLKAEGAK